MQCLLKDQETDIIFTDESFKQAVTGKNHLFAQVPYHRARKYIIKFWLGKIPEWRNRFSQKWILKNLKTKYSQVYSFIYSKDCLKFAHFIAKKLGLPLVVHIADHSKGFEEASTLAILRNCKTLICISDTMGMHYSSLTSRNDVQVIHNGVEEHCFRIKKHAKHSFSESNPFNLCFLGGLFSHLHGDCIEDCISAVEKVRIKYPWFEFHLFGQRQPHDFLEKELQEKGIFHHGIVMPLEKKYEIMEKAHCFLIPSTFNEQNHSHYKFSFPTKLTELIASGRPILSYGPQDTATNRFLSHYNIGIQVNQRSIEKIALELLEFIESYTQRAEVSYSTRKTIEESFSANATRSRIAQIFDSA